MLPELLLNRDNALPPLAGGAWSVELASCLMAQYRADRAAMPASRLGLLHSVLSKFGFNPSDRSRVQVPKPKSKNPFDDDDW
jgi:hypothetical protein